jgi:chromosome partitioning protein
MLVLALLAPKGGTGKTTIAAALAVEASRRGRRVGLVDLDGGQRSLSMWWGLRAGEPELDLKDRPLELVPPERFPDETLTKALAEPFDVLIIDGLPGDIERTALAVTAADFILVPSQPSPLDTLAMDAVVELAREAGKPLAFVLNRVKARSVAATGAREHLQGLGEEVLEQEVRDLQGYGTAMLRGATLPEIEASKDETAPQAQIAALWDAIEKRLKKAKSAHLRAAS